MNTLFSLILLLFVASCTTVETVSPPQQINVDSLKEQLKELQKITQVLEEEIIVLKSELSLVQENIKENTVNDVLQILND